MCWNRNQLTELLQIRYPIFQAGMAGGVTTDHLVGAVSEFGGLGQIGAGYMQPEEITLMINRVRERTAKPFAVNLFVMENFPMPSLEEMELAAKALETIESELNVEQLLRKMEVNSKWVFENQVEEVLKEKVPIVSFTFGIPGEEIVRELKKNAAVLIGTATTVKDALRLEASGMDAIVIQGEEAGGHRGTFHGEQDELIPVHDLVAQVVPKLRIPVIAAGGMMNGESIQEVLDLGAQGVQLGTAFLTCEESGAASAYKEILINGEEETVLTRAFSGKLARGIHNQFITEMNEKPTLPFPYQNTLTGGLRKKAAAQGNAQFMSLWAGSNYGMAVRQTVSELMERLVYQIDGK
ncbi:NAD(P)H-dependent flavin oxidoreductase [Cytobacillus gottheilii]|uniref:NAD(P)H-dependent flavin oxidoreductase n=1 Tax=Cytobacillus gottheilii TaxID=859144 RepID=UPI0009BAEEAF|nr:nitronate monooxygenase [Cytobacillus gottheilii]